MGQPGAPHKVKLITGLLSRNADAIRKAGDMLACLFGKIDMESPLMDFRHSEYYTDEMGPGLKRKFLSFEKLADIDDIYDVKLRTNALEKKLSAGGRRTVNIDPGYIDLAKLVLFSTKDYTHRIYLADGIFAEVTLCYKDGRYHPWPWTYPDYKTEGYLNFFNSVRQLYREQISE
ncbi:MAG: DUF4416 family protein [Candidatus Omnitrophica bacterium]|nr:DUF4416 family protein [Candidatus Omnitrophota bacterium]